MAIKGEINSNTVIRDCKTPFTSMHGSSRQLIKKKKTGPGWVIHLIRALSQYTKVEVSTPGQGTYKNQ